MLDNINEDEGQKDEDKGQTFDRVGVNRIETEGSDEHGVLYNINEDEGHLNDDDEGQGRRELAHGPVIPIDALQRVR